MPTIAAPVRASQYCNGDGSNEDAGFSAFLAALTAGGRVYDGIIDIPVSLASAKTLSGYVGNLRGEGAGRLIFTGGTDGLTIDNSGLGVTQNVSLSMSRVGIFTTGLSTGTGLRVKGSSTNSQQLVSSLDASDLVLSGETPSAGWQISFEGTQLKKARIVGINTRGLIPALSGGIHNMSQSALFSIYLHDGCNQLNIINPRLDWGQYGVYVGSLAGEEQNEGIVLDGGDVRAHRFGFVADPTNGQQYQSRGVHYDTSNIGVSLGKDGAIDADFSFVTGNFFLRSSIEGFTGSYTPIVVNANYAIVSGNNMFVNGLGGTGGRFSWSDSVGITIGSDTDSAKVGRSGISDNIITGFNTPIHLRSKTTGCLVSSSLIYPFGNPNAGGIMDDGAGNTVIP
jgi:hypothetical protein